MVDHLDRSAFASKTALGASKDSGWGSTIALDADAAGAYLHATPASRVTQVTLTAIIPPLDLLLTWSTVGILHSERPAGRSFADSGLEQPQHLTYLITYFSTVLNALVAWCMVLWECRDIASEPTARYRSRPSISPSDLSS